MTIHQLLFHGHGRKRDDLTHLVQRVRCYHFLVATIGRVDGSICPRLWAKHHRIQFMKYSFMDPDCLTHIPVSADW